MQLIFKINTAEYCEIYTFSNGNIFTATFRTNAEIKTHVFIHLFRRYSVIFHRDHVKDLFSVN